MMLRFLFWQQPCGVCRGRPPCVERTVLAGAAAFGRRSPSYHCRAPVAGVSLLGVSEAGQWRGYGGKVFAITAHHFVKPLRDFRNL